MIENPAIQAQERHNNRPYRYRTPLYDPCECGLHEAAALYKGNQRLCETCLKGILEVELL